RFSLGAAPGCVGGGRAGCGSWDTFGKNFRTEPQPAAPVIRRTGSQGARAVAARGPWGAQYPPGASARPAAALTARDRARISTRRAARQRLRPRASSGLRTLARVAFAGGPPAPPSLARLPACVLRLALALQQRRTAARRVDWAPARPLTAAPGWRQPSARGSYPKSALKSLLKPAWGSCPKSAPKWLLKARGSCPKSAPKSPLKLPRGSLPKRASAAFLPALAPGLPLWLPPKPLLR